VRGILKSSNFGIRIPDEFGDQESLFSRGIIDSFGLLAFINELQSKFGFKVENREIHPGNFETLDRIAAFVCTKKEEEND
jgi:acyl carrier protein